jgi:hypothetical protein
MTSPNKYYKIISWKENKHKNLPTGCQSLIQTVDMPLWVTNLRQTKELT